MIGVYRVRVLVGLESAELIITAYCHGISLKRHIEAGFGVHDIFKRCCSPASPRQINPHRVRVMSVPGAVALLCDMRAALRTTNGRFEP